VRASRYNHPGVVDTYVKKMAGVINCKVYFEYKIHVFDVVHIIQNNVFTINDCTSRLITHWISSQAHRLAEKSVAVSVSCSEYGRVAGCCECGNEPSGSI